MMGVDPVGRAEGPGGWYERKPGTPGFIRTDSSTYYVTEGLGLDYERATARLREATPVRRHGTPEDVAALVGYLASDAASFATGQCIVIDGGITITSPMTRMGERP